MLGYVLARLADQRPDVVHVTDLYVREGARRRGVAKALLDVVVDAAREQGRTYLTLEVVSTNQDALAVYRRLGFAGDREEARREARGAGAARGRRAGRELRCGARPDRRRAAVETAVANYLPRVGRSGNDATRHGVGQRLDARRGGAVRPRRAAQARAGVVRPARRGRGLAGGRRRRGRALPAVRAQPHGRRVPVGARVLRELPPGDALALRANPTVVSRLTGADPARLRAIARTAETAAELPPAAELYEQIAELMGLQA